MVTFRQMTEDDVPAAVSERIRMGAFEELFPHVKRPVGQDLSS